ncbi:MAG: hypothetical protein RLZZ516_1394 [Cyanobacteriota bacterium]
MQCTGGGADHQGTEPTGAVSLMRNPTLDRQAAATSLAGALLIAISFLTNYGHGALLHLSTFSLDEQIGVSLHAAALAALFGDAELATRLRDRTRDREAETRERELEERNREAQERERSTRRHIAALRFQLADTPVNRLRLNETLALLLEELKETNAKSPESN